MALIKRVIELVVMFKIELREKTRRIGTYPSLSTLHSLFLVIDDGTLLILKGYTNLLNHLLQPVDSRIYGTLLAFTPLLICLT